MSAPDNTSPAQGQGNGCLGYLFGAVFLLAGLGVMGFLGGAPLLRHWETRGWTQVPATIIESQLHRNTSDGSTTYRVSATYRYRVGGNEYVGSSPSIYTSADNFGDYWPRLGARLERARVDDRTVTAYVNPARPEEAYLDRSVRPGVLLFAFAFGGVFALVGGGVLGAMRYARRKRERSLSAAPIFSRERAVYWVPFGMGVVFALFTAPALPDVFDKAGQGEYVPLVVLLFPLAGLGLMLGGWRMRRTYMRFGPSPLLADPWPGQAGGQVGGEITLRSAWRDGNRLSALLSCIRCRETGSGKNRRTSETVLWQSEQTPFGQASAEGSSIRFCFDVPAELPPNSEGGREYIQWRLLLEGELDGHPFSRSWDLPVEQGEAISSRPLPSIHLERDRHQRLTSAQTAAERQIQVERTAEGLRLSSAAGRHLGMKLPMLLFGLIFALVGGIMFYRASRDGAMLYLMGTVFGGSGAAMTLGTLYLLGRSLAVEIRGREVSSLRRWLGIPIARRACRVTRADQLVLRAGMSQTSNSRKTEYVTLFVEGDGPRLRLAEGIAGREVAEALRDRVVEMLRLE